MNYFSKNLKTLRAENKLSQVEFGLLFDLSKSNINSYENGAFPKLEKYIQIMDHFQLDPSKFVKVDMELETVRRTKPGDTPSREEVLNSYVRSGVPESDQFRYLDNFSLDQIKEVYIRLFRTKEQLLKENTELKEKYIEVLEKGQKD